MRESLLFLQRINALYNTGTFSKTDRILADYLIDNPQAVDTETASSLATITGTSAASVVRFCRKLGFGGLADMKKSAAGIYTHDTEKALSLNQDDSAADVKKKVINYTKMIIDQMAESINDEAMERTAEAILNAKQVVIISEGGSGTISKAAYDILLKLAIPCKYVDDLIFQTMEISMMDKDDLLLIIVNSGRTLNVLQNAMYARERGLKVIGIVGPANSPLSQFLDIEILTNVFSSEYFSDISAARACELMCISILHSIIALKRTEEEKQKSREIGRAIEIKRIPKNMKFK